LRQARGDVLLGHIAGIGRKFEALRERDFGGGELVIIGQDAADLLQQGDLVVDAVSRDGRHEIELAAPLGDCLPCLALPFEAGAKVDGGGGKVGLQRQRGAKFGLATGFVTDLLQQRRAVEVRDEQQRMRFIERDPDLVKLARLVGLEPAACGE
jgi:hypothetical protein